MSLCQESSTPWTYKLTYCTASTLLQWIKDCPLPINTSLHWFLFSLSTLNLYKYFFSLQHSLQKLTHSQWHRHDCLAIKTILHRSLFIFRHYTESMASQFTHFCRSRSIGGCTVHLCVDKLWMMSNMISTAPPAVVILSLWPWSTDSRPGPALFVVKGILIARKYWCGCVGDLLENS